MTGYISGQNFEPLVNLWRQGSNHWKKGADDFCKVPSNGCVVRGLVGASVAMGADVKLDERKFVEHRDGKPVLKCWDKVSQSVAETSDEIVDSPRNSRPFTPITNEERV